MVRSVALGLVAAGVSREEFSIRVAGLSGTFSRRDVAALRQFPVEFRKGPPAAFRSVPRLSRLPRSPDESVPSGRYLSRNSPGSRGGKNKHG